MAISLGSLALLGLAIASAMLALIVVKYRDMVYASASLALLGLTTAGIIAMLGFPIVAVFLVIVYVGAAVMFIIVSVSMLGGGGSEEWDEYRGAAVGAAAAGALAIIALLGGVWELYSQPAQVSLSRLAELLAGDFAPVLVVIAVGLAATILEGIAIARRGR